MKKLLCMVALTGSVAILAGCGKQDPNAGAPASSDSIYGGTTGGTLSTNPPGSESTVTNTTPGSPAGATGGNTPGGSPKSATP